jgi:hypothetical protein
VRLVCRRRLGEIVAHFVLDVAIRGLAVEKRAQPESHLAPQ